MEVSEEISKSETVAAEGFAQIQLKKASAFLEAIDREGLDKIDGVVFSEGSLHVVIAALMRPEKFKNLVLINPSGITGKRSFLDFVKGAVEDGKKEGERVKENERQPQKEGRVAKLHERETPDYGQRPRFLKSGFFSSIEALASIPGSDILDALAQIKEKGVRVAVIQSADDRIYPMEKIQDMVTSEHLDGFLSVSGTHTEFSANPERYGRIIDNILTSLDNKPESPKGDPVQSK